MTLGPVLVSLQRRYDLQNYNVLWWRRRGSEVNWEAEGWFVSGNDKAET